MLEEILHKYRIKRESTIRKLVKEMNISVVAVHNTIKRQGDHCISDYLPKSGQKRGLSVSPQKCHRSNIGEPFFIARKLYEDVLSNFDHHV